MKKLKIKNIFLLLICLSLLIYVSYQVYNLHCSKIKIEPAILDTVHNYIDVDGIIVRDETIIYNDDTNILKYVINDGDKVAANGVIAEIYESNEDILVKTKLQDINNEIDKLHNLSCSFKSSSTNPERINQLIVQKLKSVNLNVSDGNYLNLYNDKTDILYLINEYKFIVGDSCDLSTRIKDLQNMKNELKFKPSVRSITSPKAGYFVNSLDGYEGLIPYDKVLSITIDDINKESLINKQRNLSTIGKIIGNLNWYIVCKVPYSKMMDLNVGKDVTITFPFTYNYKIPCKIEAINQSKGDLDAAVILKCNYMNKEFAKIRNEKIKINVESFFGIRVNKSAIHKDVVKKEYVDENENTIVEEKEVQGVYVLYGGKLVFKQILPIYSGNDYVIVQNNPDQSVMSTNETLEVYDRIVTRGIDLYDGKVVR